ncbi:hypothetical protein EJ04DRAFT_576239 [Polyplosphaeria fusca]|uniref:Uncharacterized protein n=1 Tax=Polyplosphaeria fusca TaxID=682080 RepID=A0A9P4R1W6_9PLEO|nr:hypothetical protein EJ04DRAFT_576239 [Polyplosphaeria fusca]
MGIDKRLPYRLGTSEMPPLPVEWDIVDEKFPPKIEKAVAIAKEYLKDETLSVLYIQRTGEEHNTVLIESCYAPNLKDKWLTVIEMIYECLKTEDGLFAELVDHGVHFRHIPEAITTAKVDLHQVVALFDDHEWMTVDVVGWYSPVHQKLWPTIVITARDAGKGSWWSKKIPAVEQFVKDQGVDLQVVLRFLDRMFYHPHRDFYEYSGEFGRSPYDGPQIGRSLGIPNMNGSASLGCRILVEDGSQFGVTSCRSFQQGPGSTQTGLVGLNMQTPSPNDDRIVKEDIRDDEEAKALKVCNLGKILAVSSKPLHTDWCLFEMDRLEFVDKDPKVWAQIKHGNTYHVQKIGRTTRLTKGTIGAYPSLINLQYIEHAQDDGQIIDGQIISVRCIVSPKYADFYLPGDCGASVQDVDSGAILGFCAGYNQGTMVSYMTPMATIIGEIDDVLTSKIKEPKEIQIQHGTRHVEEDQDLQQPANTATFL